MTITYLTRKKNSNLHRQELCNLNRMEARMILENARMEQKRPDKKPGRRLEWLIIVAFILAHALVAMSQTGGLNDLNYQATSEFVPTIKDAIKLSEMPEIKDSVKKIENIRYGIASRPLIAKYEVQKIEAAKLQNEPLNRLYHSLLKIGYGPIYNMPYGEFWIANGRSKETSFGGHLKHFSSTTHLRDVGYGGFSDNAANVFGKRFYKRHTLSGDLKYELNGLHYYGYDTSLNKVNDEKFTRQRYQYYSPSVQLKSHYNDSDHVNHDLRLSYYNLQNLYRESENNIRFSGTGDMFINKEKFNLGFLTDYYNHKQANDTLNDLIVSVNPSFEANGKKWHADMGVTGTFDNFRDKTKFYFYPQLNLHYDIYENLVIPYAGVNGGLIKNSFRKLSQENPFVDTTINYQNTNNRYNLFGGLRGNLSSNTSYDARVTYGQYDSLYFYVIDYSGPAQMYNNFKVIYDNTSILTVSGQLKYQTKEKLNIIAKGNYYIYQTKNQIRAFHKPDYDLDFAAIYNLRSKFILRADLFFFGQQWSLSPVTDASGTSLKPKKISAWADLNLEGEYRYSKMLSFFARVNNLGNQRYYRWERYPTQKFNLMLGLTFVPF
jgi:hypothetical protein